MLALRKTQMAYYQCNNAFNSSLNGVAPPFAGCLTQLHLISKSLNWL